MVISWGPPVFFTSSGRVNRPCGKVLTTGQDACTRLTARLAFARKGKRTNLFQISSPAKMSSARRESSAFLFRLPLTL